MTHFRLPSITGRTDAEKIQQIHSFLRQLVDQLNLAMLEIGKETTNAANIGVQNAGVDTEQLNKGVKIARGEAVINYGASATYTDVQFGRTFSAPPSVVTSQVFDTGNIIVHDDDITETGFRMTVAPIGSTGTRTVQWIAIGI